MLNSPTVEPHEQDDVSTAPLAGQRVGLVGKLASMSRTDAARMCRRAGGVLVYPVDDSVTLLVQGDNTAGNEALPEEVAARIAAGELPTIDETTLLDRVGLVDSSSDVRRLYTPAMLSELLDVPLAAVRRWIRKGYLQPACEVRRLAYFDFPEVTIGRRLAEMVRHGVSLATIDKKLADLERQLPNVSRPLAELSVVVDGGNLYLQRDGSIEEPSGQRLLAFEEPEQPGELHDDESPAISLALPPGDAPPDPDELRALALDLADQGDTERAIELYRGIHLSGLAYPDDHFVLAELLYLLGEPQAARERYYMAIELDDELIEARVNLGVLLGELGEIDLAVSALEGAIDQHPGFADAHYHLARLLENLDRDDEAAAHWRTFLQLAPESPWADEARERLGE